jgi:hypothetical protein
MQNGTNWAHRRTSSLNEVASQFFATDAPNPLQFDPQLIFWCISDRLILAWKSMQNGPNWGHQRTNSLNEVASQYFATNAPYPLDLTQNSYFCLFRTISLPQENKCKMGRTGVIDAQVHKMKLRRNFPLRTHPTHSNGHKTHVLVRFGPCRYRTKIDAKRAELGAPTH